MLLRLWLQREVAEPGLIHLFNLSTYCVLDTVLCVGDIAVNKTDLKHFGP